MPTMNPAGLLPTFDTQCTLTRRLESFNNLSRDPRPFSIVRICSRSGIAARGGRGLVSSESGRGRLLSGRAPLPAVEVRGQPTGDLSRIVQTVFASSVTGTEGIPSPAALLTTASRVASANMCCREPRQGPETWPVAMGAIAVVPRTAASAAPS